MRKIPLHISSYVDESVNRVIAHLDNQLDRKFKELDLKFKELDLKFKESNALMIKEFEHQKGAILNEFDNHLKTFGEYLDTKTSRDAVQEMIDDEFQSRGL